MSVIDFSLLEYCADSDCPILAVHARHRRIRSIRVDRARVDPVVGVTFAGGRGDVLDVSTLDDDDIDLTSSAVTVVDHDADVVVPDDDDNLWEVEGRRVSLALLRSVYAAVPENTPRSSMDVYHTVINSYGSVARRWVIGALSALTRSRRIASLTNPWLPKELQRSMQQTGWYVRYDSPKLWRPDGFRDLLRIVAEQDMERT